MNSLSVLTAERIQRLQRLGYTEREAHFLCLAALHGGYFLRRQYVRFLGKTVGGTAAALVEKVIGKAHAKGTTYAGGVHIYHLCSRPFYNALGEENNRNRRLRQPSSMKAKLMALDFVLEHPDVPFLATEREKTDYILTEFDLDSSVLPVTRFGSGAQQTERAFVEKFPIHLSPSCAPEGRALVSFCYVDEGAVGTSGLVTFLQKYRRLFAALPEFGFSYVAAQETHFEAAAHIFDRQTRAPQTELWPHIDLRMDDLVSYFDARKLSDARQWDTFDRAKLIRFREDSERFKDPAIDRLYKLWQVQGTVGLQTALTAKSGATQDVSGTFSTYLLRENYELFGTIAA